MDNSNIRKNLQTSAFLSGLCIMVLITCLLLQWWNIAIAMGAFTLLQFYILFIWGRRKRNQTSRFKRKSLRKP